MPLASIDPQWAPIIAAFATLLTALGWSERRRRQQKRADDPDLVEVQATNLFTEWQKVLGAMETRARWAEQQERLCEERNEMLERRIDDLAEKVRGLSRKKRVSDGTS